MVYAVLKAIYIIMAILTFQLLTDILFTGRIIENFAAKKYFKRCSSCGATEVENGITKFLHPDKVIVALFSPRPSQFLVQNEHGMTHRHNDKTAIPFMLVFLLVHVSVSLLTLSM